MQLAAAPGEGQGGGVGGLAGEHIQGKAFAGFFHGGEDVVADFFSPVVGLRAQQRRGQGPGAEAAGRFAGGRRRQRAIEEKVAVAEAQVFQQGLLIKRIEVDKRPAQGRREDGPVLPVRAGFAQLVGRGPAQDILVRLFIGRAKAQGEALAQVEQHPDGLAVRRILGGLRLAAHEQPEATIGKLGHAGRDAAAQGIFAQAHDRRGGRATGSQAAAGEKEEGLLAVGAQAELNLAFRLAVGQGQAATDEAGQGFLNLFQPRALKAGHGGPAKADEKMRVHDAFIRPAGERLVPAGGLPPSA